MKIDRSHDRDYHEREDRRIAGTAEEGETQRGVDFSHWPGAWDAEEPCTSREREPASPSFYRGPE